MQGSMKELVHWPERLVVDKVIRDRTDLIRAVMVDMKVNKGEGGGGRVA